MIERLERGWVSRAASLVLSFVLPFATAPGVAWALPHGGVVTKGGAILSYSTAKLLVSQSTSSASYSWSSYNVGSSQSVTYKTPGAKSVSMNYIGGTTPAVISGKVTSNGILYFMDANGLVFGQGSVISAAGIRAYGAASPTAPPSGPVTNAGTLTAAPGGAVVLVGTSVANTGTIAAPGGEVVMASGKMVTLSQTSGSSFSVMTSGGGSIYNSGVISAETVVGKTGQIILQSGMDSGTTTLESTAVLDASAPNGGNGGAITVNGYKVVLDQIASLNVSAPSGTPGTITIDPTVTHVGTASALEAIDSSQSTYLNNSNVCIALTASINLMQSNGSLYPWKPLGNSSNPFTGTFNGNGYTVSGYTIGNQNYAGFIGYLGSGGVVKNLGVAGTINTNGCDVGGVVGFNNGGTVEYSYNTGAVSGSTNVGGVVGENYGGTVETSYNTGSVTVSSSNSSVGGVVGFNHHGGTVEKSYNTGSVTGSVSGCDNVGGVVGKNYESLNSNLVSRVETSYNTGSVSGSSNVGGVVGENYDGTVEDSYYNSTINHSLNSIGVGSGTNVSGLSEGTSANTDLGNSGSYSGWSFASGWNGSGFSTSGTWIIGTVYPNGGTSGISAPILVPDLPTATVTGNSGTSVYNGSHVSPGYATAYTMGGTTLSPNVTVTTSVGPNAGTYTNAPSVSFSEAPPTQTSVYSVTAVSGIWTIDRAPLTATANLVSMTYGETVPALSGTITGFVNGQTLSGDGGSWNTSATSSSNIGSYGVSLTLGRPYSGDYTITAASGNGTALTIGKADLILSTTASKTYDGGPGIVLTASDTTILGIPTGLGQVGSLDNSLPATFSSSSDGSNLGGSVSLASGDLTGNSSFRSALDAGDYTLSSTFLGGSILPLASSSIVPAAQVNSANISQLATPTGLNGNSLQAGSPASSLPTLALLPSGSFVSSLGGGLNMGDLTEDSSAVFDVSSANTFLRSAFGDETVLSVGPRDIQPVDTESLNESLQMASPTSSSGINGEKALSVTKDRNAKPFNLLILSGSNTAPYSLQIPTFRLASDNGVFESQEER